MPAYVNTSALVKRYIAEVGSAWMRRLLTHPAQYVIYTAALAQAEVISTLQRRVRAGHLEVARAQRLAQRVTGHFAQRYQVIAITQAIVDHACVVLQAHSLRAADAIHLACALTVGVYWLAHGPEALYTHPNVSALLPRSRTLSGSRVHSCEHWGK